LAVEGDKWAIRISNPQGKPLQNNLNFRIDPSKTPKSLDIIRKGTGEDAKNSVEKCIYKLDKDTLTVCSLVRDDGNPDKSKDRPKDFQPPDGDVIRVFKRVD
jgi:uncharacterized protein (TIGR03067 family)